MTDIIVIAILAVILGAAVGYIYKTKKSGAKCIGCVSGSCSGKCGSCACGCGSGDAFHCEGKEC